MFSSQLWATHTGGRKRVDTRRREGEERGRREGEDKMRRPKDRHGWEEAEEKRDKTAIIRRRTVSSSRWSLITTMTSPSKTRSRETVEIENADNMELLNSREFLSSLLGRQGREEETSSEEEGEEVRGWWEYLNGGVVLCGPDHSRCTLR